MTLTRKSALDIAAALQKLKGLFRIDSLMICGGGVVNWSFLQAGMMDDLSMVVAPLTDGATDTASVFDRSPYMDKNIPAAFSLIDVDKLPGNGIWLKYRLQNTDR